MEGHSSGTILLGQVDTLEALLSCGWRNQGNLIWFPQQVKRLSWVWDPLRPQKHMLIRAPLLRTWRMSLELHRKNQSSALSGLASELPPRW